MLLIDISLILILFMKLIELINGEMSPMGWEFKRLIRRLNID